jgi:hypothetical protein
LFDLALVALDTQKRPPDGKHPPKEDVCEKRLSQGLQELYEIWILLQPTLVPRSGEHITSQTPQQPNIFLNFGNVMSGNGNINSWNHRRKLNKSLAAYFSWPWKREGSRIFSIGWFGEPLHLQQPLGILPDTSCWIWTISAAPT